jgi:hypothetical protein
MKKLYYNIFPSSFSSYRLSRVNISSYRLSRVNKLCLLSILTSGNLEDELDGMARHVDWNHLILHQKTTKMKKSLSQAPGFLEML